MLHYLQERGDVSNESWTNILYIHFLFRPQIHPANMKCSSNFSLMLTHGLQQLSNEHLVFLILH